MIDIFWAIIAIYYVGTTCWFLGEEVAIPSPLRRTNVVQIIFLGWLVAPLGLIGVLTDWTVETATRFLASRKGGADV